MGGPRHVRPRSAPRGPAPWASGTLPCSPPPLTALVTQAEKEGSGNGVPLACVPGGHCRTLRVLVPQKTMRRAVPPAQVRGVGGGHRGQAGSREGVMEEVTPEGRCRWDRERNTCSQRGQEEGGLAEGNTISGCQLPATWPRSPRQTPQSSPPSVLWGPRPWPSPALPQRGFLHLPSRAL